MKKIAYTIWLEWLNSPILRGQVIEVLKKMGRRCLYDKFYLFAFQPLHRVILRHREYCILSKELKDNNIILITIPSLVPPKFDWFNAKWYMIPIIFLQSFPILLLLTFIKKIDILHCRSYPIMLAAITIKKINKNLKIIFDPRSPFPEENITAGRWTEQSFTYKMWKYLEKRYLEESNVTIAIANTYVKHFRKISSQSNFVIVPNNVDVAKFISDNGIRENFRSKMGISDDEIVFAYSGSLGNHWNNPKVYAEFIIKLRTLNIKHCFLFIVPDIKELKYVFNQCGIKSDEYFAISADLPDVPKYLAMADLGLNLMEKEDIRVSIKTVEYLAMGLPIITNSKVLGAKEIIEQYNVGLVIDDLENIDLRKIENIAKNKDELSLRCREVACRVFSTDKIAKQYLEIYNEIIR